MYLNNTNCQTASLLYTCTLTLTTTCITFLILYLAAVYFVALPYNYIFCHLKWHWIICNLLKNHNWYYMYRFRKLFCSEQNVCYQPWLAGIDSKSDLISFISSMSSSLRAVNSFSMYEFLLTSSQMSDFINDWADILLNISK